MNFPELERKKQTLSLIRCNEILQTEKRGVLSVLSPTGYPYGMPLNHLLAADGCLYFHTGLSGHRIKSISKNAKVCYTVMTAGTPLPDDWAQRVESVVVFGKLRPLCDAEKTAEIARALGAKFTDDTDYVEREIRESLAHTLLLQLTPEHITGKIVDEK